MYFKRRCRSDVMKIKEFLKKVNYNQNPVENSTVNDAAEPRRSLEEMLAFYMERARNLGEELAQTKAKLEQVVTENQTLSEANQELKEALKIAEKKIARLEKKNMRLAAIEKVWEETFSKIKIVAGNIPNSDSTEEQNILDFDNCAVAVDYDE